MDQGQTGQRNMDSYKFWFFISGLSQHPTPPFWQRASLPYSSRCHTRITPTWRNYVTPLVPFPPPIPSLYFKFLEENYNHCVFVCTEVSIQHPTSEVHCLTDMEVLSAADHTFQVNIFAWYSYIIDNELSATVVVNPQCTVPVEPVTFKKMSSLTLCKTP